MESYLNPSEKNPHHSIIITVNARLALTLRERHDQQCAEQGLKAWHTPNILSLTQWISAFWPWHAPGQLLGQDEEQQLWAKYIQEAIPHLIDPQQAAHSMQQAYQLCRSHLLDRTALQHTHLHPESQHLLRCWEALAQRCQQEQWVCMADALSLISDLEQLPEALVPHQGTLHCVGFDALSPQLTHCLQSLQARRPLLRIQQHSTPPQPNGKTFCCAADDPEHEIRCMIHWAQTRIAQGQRIACIVPRLSQERATLVQALDRAFHPSMHWPGQPLKHSTLYNISAAPPLSERPLVASALRILSLCTPQLCCQRLAATLLDPFIQHQDERSTALSLHHALWHSEQDRIKAEVWQQQLAQLPPPPSAYAQRWLRFLSFVAQAPTQATRTAWVHWFWEALHQLGWPGGEGLHSHQHQSQQALLQALACWQKSDPEHAEISLKAARSSLRQHIKQTPFQPEGHDAPLQVLGILEASGQRFDALWVMGMDEQHWPPPPAPNPFIPTQLQQQHAMPHSSMERERDYAEALMAQCQAMAPHAVYSYARQCDHIAQDPSPLIPEHTTWVPPALNPGIKPPNNIELHWQDDPDHQAPPLQPEEQPKGGSALFQWQAACPFQAFARARLHLKPNPNTYYGINPRQQGNWMHNSLMLFWQQTQSQDALLDMDHTQLSQRIASSIQQAEPITFKQSEHHPKPVRQLEAQRLQHLLHDWLSFEKKRTPFWVVGCEKEVRFACEGLTLRIRMDRIDRDAHGNRVIIDYKSGATHIVDWFGPRIQAPQLPLYTVFGQQKNDALAFAQLKHNALDLKGLRHESKEYAEKASAFGLKSIAKIKDGNTPLNWQGAQRLWEENLRATARAFLRGDARVDPYAPKSCSFCHCKALCRVQHTV